MRQTPFLSISDLHVQYGKITAVNGMAFDVREAEMVTLLGPSGCGKTTTLRCIAGLETPDRGIIKVQGDVLTQQPGGVLVPPEKRSLAMVFQSYAIWPHMNVFENVAYGLRARRVDPGRIRARVQEVLRLVGLGGMDRRPATQLSGGQQQRVALARAIVLEPKILLLDEPLSNLDAKLRESTRVELRDLQQRLGITAVYVTHDQAEAMALSDRLIVMRNGVIEQEGPPLEVYMRPRTAFVADFMGRANLLAGVVLGREDGRLRVETALGPVSCIGNDRMAPGDKVLVCIRPETLRLGLPGNGPARARVIRHTHLGEYVDYYLAVGDKILRARALAASPKLEGDVVDVSFEGPIVAVPYEELGKEEMQGGGHQAQSE